MSTTQEAADHLSEFLEGHLDNATSKSPTPYSRLIWLYGDEEARNRALRKNMMTPGDPTALDRVVGIGHLQRLIWLEPIDMTALPKSTNFPMAILVRLDSCLNRIPNRPIGRIDGLNAAKRNFALGFPGNIKERAGALDPDSYAVEVQQTELARINAAESFEFAVEQTAKQFSNNPLFVLPVLNLEFGYNRIDELFKLSRVMRSHRLVFVLTSDEEIPDVARHLQIDVGRYIGPAQLIKVVG